VGSGFLKFADFRKLLDDNPHIRHVELSNYGEIFLNPQLLLILEEAYGRKVALTAGNGVNLNNVREEVLEGLVKYRVQRLQCSIDGASQETYQRYRVRGNYETVIRNIETINRHKERHASRLPVLAWQFIAFGHNEHEIPLARAKAAELGMEFAVKLSWDDDLSPVRNTRMIRRSVPERAASRAEYKKRTGRDYMVRICDQLWDRPQINWDGKLLGCCRNFWGDFGGNAFKEDLPTLLNGEKIRHARRMLLGKAPARPDIPCTTCDIYLQMQKSGLYLERRGFQKVSRQPYPATFD
jgi:MoaA/NifB/PqqE/SkfB family radical SAM enzyme